MALLQRSLNTHRLTWAACARDGVLGVAFCFVLVMATALLCFTPPVLAGMGVNSDILSFFWSNMTTEALTQQVFYIAPDLGMSFTPMEAAHLADVKGLLHTAALATAALSALIAAGSLLFRPSWQYISLWALTTLTLAGVTLGTLWFFWGFKPLSAAFHSVLFTDGNWQFSPHQLMMQLYPPVVMQTGLVICFTVAFVMLATLTTILWHKHTR